MDALYEAAVLYKPLLHKDYHIVAAYRQEQIRIKFIFLPEHFYHLVGFHKLLDLKALVQPRMLLHKVLSREITASVIRDSKFYADMEDRLHDFGKLHELIDLLQSGEIVIEFAQQNRTRIQADFLLFRKSTSVYTHLFLRHDQRYGYVPCSFFCRGDNKYIRNNKKYYIVDFSVSDYRQEE
ncbi:MAG: PBECR4 domain-containing protein [Selenomonadaceae bacterium]|nr:PBECR4 domain-containing protein [Selenomonadaceae bacterium]MDD7057355.1 PBECR4 domain-containing protein [Selenomonadaceae bacterium]MDY3917282.1 PBECR4 domain-containing protein [Selenomonadaceae bacterium]